MNQKMKMILDQPRNSQSTKSESQSVKTHHHFFALFPYLAAPCYISYHISQIAHCGSQFRKGPFDSTDSMVKYRITNIQWNGKQNWPPILDFRNIQCKDITNIQWKDITNIQWRIITNIQWNGKQNWPPIPDTRTSST